MSRTQCAFVSVVLFFSQASLFASDALNQVREQTRQPGQPSTEKPRRDYSEPDDCDDDTWFSVLFGEFFFIALTSPWVGPYVALEPEGPVEADLPRYPYQADLPGYLIIESPHPPETYYWGARFSTEYGNDFDGLHRLGGRLLVEHTSRFGVDLEFNDYVEDAAGGNDSLWTGDGNIVYRFAQSEDAEFHTGLGVSWLADDLGSELGFNFTYGATLFPSKPWILDFSLDAGTLGDAGRLHLHATGGWNWKALEVFGGYDWQRIGNADLHGPVAGFRLWF